MTLRMCVLLWEQPGRNEDLAEFEDAVLAMVPDHGGAVLSRETVIDRADGDPLEVQILEMPDEQAVTAHLADPRRAALPPREEIIARTQVLRIMPVNPRR
jgi:uncharacterized protein (DUF1330 family)